MKKNEIKKRIIAFAAAAVLAITVYAPEAAFATEDQEAKAPETTQSSEPAEKPAPEPAAEAPAPAPEPAAEAPAPSPEPAAPAASSEPAPAPAPEAPAASSEAAPAADQEAAPAESSTEASEGSAVVLKTQEAEGQDDAVKEEAAGTEASEYGEATGNWGYANETGTTRWDEYVKDGKTTLVFKVNGENLTDEEKAITKIVDEAGNSVKEMMKSKVTNVVLESGITGIGWKALYDKGSYEPQYTSDYKVDRSETDVFKDFTKLTSVTPCETLKRIGWSAFRKCGSLSDFDFTKCPELEEIMNQAFNECKSLNLVDLSVCDSLQTIRWSAFKGAGKGKDAKLVLPENGSLTVIGGYAFDGYASNNKEGTEVDFSGIADSTEEILQYAFNNSHVKGEISGFKNLEKLGNNALRNSFITYIPYVAPAEEEPVNNEEPVNTDNPVNNDDPQNNDNTTGNDPVNNDEPVNNNDPVNNDEPQAEEPAAGEESVNNEEPVNDEEVIPASEDPASAEADSLNSPIENTHASAAQATSEPVLTAGAVTGANAANTVNVREAASVSTAGAAVTTARPAEAAGASRVNVQTVGDEESPMAINDTETPQAGMDQNDQTDGISLTYLMSAMALAMLAGLSIIVIAIRRRNTEEE